jgi:small subunit ribosomal protein S6
MNVECGNNGLSELVSAFRFNDAVIRHLVMARNDAVTDPSPLAKAREEGDERPERGERGERAERAERAERIDAPADEPLAPG